MSGRLPALTPREVIRALKRGGFEVQRTSGSHVILKAAEPPHRRVTVPFHSKDLKQRTLHAIVREAGLTVEDFRKLL
jgi:predicted RNA binding protein YcfA (HicA-like mRNA interferase family)